ncbi:GIY-YIG nuclease family protein [Emcibacter nanhaiensis]|uniref:GIY-YIG nuclease family protein n=1 Tax=Emcibacter nanhaiensis TaxID=1505037 RepID=A0A501PSV6_9PROT|nr:GIY-YIG nuclease family protein [Emcibacter nanhaiensis]TPD63034.1 GIY-YIG nuclease family protein [Emcibacter nanhaiensis]
MNLKGRSIRLFLVDGSPTGLRTAEIMNWTGHVLFTPQMQLATALTRKETKRTGIYLLVGPDPEGSDRPMLYIGESDNVGNRIAQHNKDERKDWWDQAVLVTSKDQNLTKAHVRYLEARLIQMANEARQAIVENGTSPSSDEYLPESDVADMEFFLTQLELILPVLGLNVLKGKTRKEKAQAPSEEGSPTKETETFTLSSSKHGLNATALQEGDEFIVLKGSKARPSWVGTVRHNRGYSNLHTRLVEDNILVQNPGDDLMTFSEDTAFNSPSAAAAVIYGRAANGRTSWKVKGTNKTYADWQEAQLGDVEADE